MDERPTFDALLFDLLDESRMVNYFVIAQNGIIKRTSISLVQELSVSIEDFYSRNITDYIDIELDSSLINNSSKVQNAAMIINGSRHEVDIFIKAIQVDNECCFLLLLNFIPGANASKKNEYELEFAARLVDANSQIKEKSETIEFLENHIIENEIRLRLALNAVNDGIWDWNIADNKFYFSDRFFTMLGYDAFEFSQTLESWNNIIDNDSINIIDFLSSLVKSSKNDFSFEYKLKRKNYGTAWILCRGAVVERDNMLKPVRIVGTHVDISHIKEIENNLKSNEAKLKKQNEKYIEINNKLIESKRKTELLNFQLQDKQAYLNSILKTVPASITLISELIILYTNNYTCLMTGYEQEELLGGNINILFDVPRQNKLDINFFANVSPGVSKSITTVWKQKDGSFIDVYVTATSLNSEIAPNAFTISAVDISAQRLYEEELINAKEKAENAERLKTIFLNNISHELRTPMNGIIGFAEMLRETDNLSKREEYLKVIINSSKQLMRIITDLMEISKIETGEVETFYSTINLPLFFHELHESSIGLLQQRNKENIEIIFVKPSGEIADHIQTDELKLRYILYCLLMNAVKFTENGLIKFGYEKNKDNLQFFVSDTGIGIDEPEKEIIFESFRQSDSPVRKKYGGNGLGLAIARGFTKVLGGKIWVESQVGEGSVFYVEVPYKPIIEEFQKQEEVERIYYWEDYHILVVEDDITCYTLIEELLEETGIRISHAATGLEAVKICRKVPEIDIVLMDMRLPEIDGYEATKRIKEYRPELAIIAQTAHALSEDRKKCISAGCNDYITKPLEQEKLLALIKKYIEITRLS